MTVSFKAPWAPTHPTAAAALADITRGRNIKVFGFGECHRDPLRSVLTVPVAFHHFAHQLFPYLVEQKGVRVFGLEHLSDSWNDIVSSWFAPKDPDPSVWINIQGDLERWDEPNRNAIKIFLQKGRGLHQRFPLLVNGVNTDPFIVGLAYSMNARGNDFFMTEIVREINSNVATLYSLTMQQGAGLALFNGASHITTEPDPKDDASYVPMLRKSGLSLTDFLSVRLIVPEYCMEEPEPPDSDLEASLHAPTSGVHVREVGEQSYAITFARSG